MNIKNLPKDMSNMWTYLKNMDKTKWQTVAKNVTPGLIVGTIGGAGTIALAGSPNEQGKKNYAGGALIGAGLDLAVVGAAPAWKNRLKLLPSLFKKAKHITWKNSEVRKQLQKVTVDKTLATLFEKSTPNKLKPELQKQALSPELLTRAGNMSLDQARKLLDAGDILKAIRKSNQGSNLISEGLDRGSQSVKAMREYIDNHLKNPYNSI